MIAPPIPIDEEQRLSALAEASILDTANDDDFDAIATLVATVCEAPIALVSFIDSDRQWFKSSIGLAPVGERSRDVSFCGHALNASSVFVVEDAREDRRFADNPFVLGEPHVRFYAGAPIRTARGHAIGSVCIIDREPRLLARREAVALERAAASIAALVEHRRTRAELRTSIRPPVVAVPRPRSTRDEALRRLDGIATSPALLAGVVAALPGIFYLVDANDRLVLWNRHLELLTGHAASEIGALSHAALFTLADRTYVAERFRLAFAQGIAQGESLLLRRDGLQVPISFTARVVECDGRTLVAAIGIDISERIQTGRILEYTALHDPLTGLENRTVLDERLRVSARLATRDDGQVALLFLDLDRFKRLNDTLGHAVGDELLRGVAQRLRAVVRAGDTVARLGGDEFAIVANVARSEELATLACNVMRTFEQPFAIGGQPTYVTTSMGISVYPDDDADPRNLLRNADTAMYEAKDLGRNGFQFFRRDMHDAAVARLAIERDLRLALERGEFALHFQPVFDIASGAVVSAEGLLRWNHPERGPIAPEGFIAIAEETGLIVPIGAWVLREGARQARRLGDLGFTQCYVSVNVSGVQLRDASFVDHVASALAAHRVERGTLGIEITESVALADTERALPLLEACSRAGLVILLDDFGTQYSSLAYLKKFPIDVIKIDKLFVDGLPENGDDRGIVQGIVALGAALDCTVLAEGVETVAQARWLATNGCRYGTGFLYARPMDADRFATWMRDSSAASRSLDVADETRTEDRCHVLEPPHARAQRHEVG
ncbi:MAG: hypothetical protein NVSMB21_15370 [Vulcanimicrobiaceae bacterium]